jgi:hypothetical protein
MTIHMILLAGSIINSGLVKTLRLEKGLDDVKHLSQIAFTVGTRGIGTWEFRSDCSKSCVWRLPTGWPSLFSGELSIRGIIEKPEV